MTRWKKGLTVFLLLGIGLVLGLVLPSLWKEHRRVTKPLDVPSDLGSTDGVDAGEGETAPHDVPIPGTGFLDFYFGVDWATVEVRRTADGSDSRPIRWLSAMEPVQVETGGLSLRVVKSGERPRWHHVDLRPGESLSVFVDDSSWTQFETPLKGHRTHLVQDLDGDARQEIVSFTDKMIECFDHRGTRLFDVTIEGSFENPRIVDLDGDGRREVLLAAVGPDQRHFDPSVLYCVLPPDTLLWAFEPGLRKLRVQELTGRYGGPQSVLLTSLAEPKPVYCLSHEGGKLWSFQPRATVTASVLADLDGDGAESILLGLSADGRGLRAVCLAAKGKELWTYTPEQETDHHGVHPMAEDLDGDGQLEVLFGNHASRLTCLDRHGKELWSVGRSRSVARHTGTMGSSEASIRIADLDGDGRKEVLSPDRFRELAVFDADGRQRWIYECEALLGICDLNGDGSREVIVIDWKTDESEDPWTLALPRLEELEGEQLREELERLEEEQARWQPDQIKTAVVTSLDADGNVLWEQQLFETEEDAFYSSNAFAADVDGDGLGELFVEFDPSGYSSVGSLFCLDRHGRVLWRYDDPEDVVTAITDLDGDGEAELILSSGIVLDPDGRPAWSLSKEPSEPNRRFTESKLDIVDLDRDLRLDLMLWTPRGLTSLESPGPLRWARRAPKEGGILPLTLGDVDGDGETEVVFGDGLCLGLDGSLRNRIVLRVPFIDAARIGEGGMVFLCKGTDLVCYAMGSGIQWEFTSNGTLTEPEIVDLDGDGEQELLSCAANGVLYCLNADGSQRWSYPRTPRNSGLTRTSAIELSPPRAADLNGDGSVEILVGWKDGSLRCFDSDGEELWSRETGRVRHRPLLLCGGDGIRSVVVATDLGQIHCLDADGNLRWSTAMPGRLLEAPTAADLDGDGRSEIVAVSIEGGVHCFGSDGDEVWTYHTRNPDILGNPVCADFDGDGRLEVAVASSPVIYGLSATGNLVWTIETEVETRILAHRDVLAVADIEGDGKSELLVKGEYELRCFAPRRAGRLLWKRSPPGW